MAKDKKPLPAFMAAKGKPPFGGKGKPFGAKSAGKKPFPFKAK